MKSYNFNFTKFVFSCFVVMIMLSLGNLLLNIVRIVQAKDVPIAMYIVSIVASSIVLLGSLIVFFSAKYKLNDEMLVLKFGFIPVLKIPLQNITRIGKHAISREIFIVYSAKNKFYTHMLCVEELFGDEIVKRIKKANDKLEYIEKS